MHSCHLCSGKSDEKFIVYISTKNGKIMNASGKIYGAMIPLFYYEKPAGTECAAYLDSLHSTILHAESEIPITPGEDGHHSCSRCKAYRCNLRALVSCHEKHTSALIPVVMQHSHA